MTSKQKRARQRLRRERQRETNAVVVVPRPVAVIPARESPRQGRAGRSFEVPPQSPPEGSSVSLPDPPAWDPDPGIPPQTSSERSTDPGLRAEFLDGAGALRLSGPHAMPGVKLTPQNYLVADVLNAGHEFNAISMPRRSSKSTSIFAVALGRLMNRPGYQVAYTMTTTALKARERFLTDIVKPIEAVHRDPKSSPWKVTRANGREQIEYIPTGARLAVLPPRGDAFRSDAWDMLIIDEAGEADVEVGDDLEAGALSTMDTRPEPQLIIAGTAAKFRDGQLLWKALEEGRAGRGGIVEFAAPQDTTSADVDEWEDAAALLLAVHPGIGNLTPLKRMKTRWEKLKRPAWLAEYAGVFGSVGATSFLDQVKFAGGRLDGDLPGPPEHFVMAFQVHPDSTTASICAAWRDDDGHARILVLWHGPVRGLQMKQLALGRRYRMPVGYDSGNSATDSEAQRLDKGRPAIRLTPQKWADVSTSAALITKEIESGTVRHWGQDDLVDAVAIATKRGTRESKRWAFGRPDDEADITALEAAALALRLYDEDPPRRGLRAVAAL